jgi:hypothetical protein
MSRALEDWAFARGVQLDLIRPSRPVKNAFIEAFSGRLRDECLNVHQFTSLEDARAKIEAWRVDYSARRPHSSLGHLTRTSSSPTSGRADRERSGFLANDCSDSGPASAIGWHWEAMFDMNRNAHERRLRLDSRGSGACGGCVAARSGKWEDVARGRTNASIRRLACISWPRR